MNRTASFTCFQNISATYVALSLLMLLLATIAYSGKVNAGCQLSVLSAEFQQPAIKQDRERIRQMQQHLTTLGYPLKMIDGLVGRETLAALTQFCDDFGFDAKAGIAVGLDDALLHYATIAEVYPGWRQTLLSGDFGAWITQQPAERQVAINKTKRSGTAQQIMTLLDLYKTQQGGGAADLAGDKRGPNFYYSLTSLDVDELEALLKPLPKTTVVPAPNKSKSVKPVVTPDVDSAVNAQTVSTEQDANTPDAAKVAENIVEADPEPELQPEPAPEPEPLISAVVVEKLRAIQGTLYPTKRLFVNAVTTQLGTNAGEYTEHQTEIESKALKGAPSSAGEISLGESDCGCVRTMSGITYGFYPSWFASADPTTSRLAVDFSTLSRIGYYGVMLDEKGNIFSSESWDAGNNAANFIANTHRYGTKADLVIFSDRWQQWNDADMENAQSEVFKKVTALHPGKLDGVTLYFDGFREYRFARVKINSFVIGLHEKFAKSNRPDITLNLMFDLGVSSIESKDRLLADISGAILGVDEAGKPYVDSIITFLEKPTTDTKKVLRNLIENEFKGIDRRNVLRKIIPVLTPIGHYPLVSGQYDQFYDDLVYFQDNFAGIGFWPLPLVSDNGSEILKKRIVKVFNKSSEDDFLKANTDKYIPQLCQFACPNRWLFRIAFDVLIGLFVIYGLLAMWNYKLRNLFKKRIWYFSAVAAVLLLIFLISLVCDPYWNKRADDLAIGLLLIGIVYGLWRYIGKMKQGPLP